MALTLDIVRHGEAAARHPDGDAARPLTPQGIAALEQLAAALHAGGWAPDRLFASPYVRAQQTAAILAGSDGPRIETLHVLEPETPPQRTLDVLIGEGIEDGHIVLVAHLPLVERLQLALAAGDAPWVPGTLARIALPRGLEHRGQLIGVWTP